MEYIHGEDVRKLWKHSETRGQPLPVPLVCRILIEASAGLDYAHKRTDPTTGRPLGIVHRDVSPQNILVTFEGGVKVVDFGIAKAADQATITRSGVLKGKYSYMCPEQAAGQRVDCRADIFALGVVLYELLTGTRLFKRSSDIQTLAAVSECRVIPPSQVTERVPPDLDAIVLKALAKDPAERYQEAAHLQHALEAWLQTHRLPASAAHLSAYMKELYAERLAEEARSGEVQVEDSEPGPPPPPPRAEPPPKRTGTQQALPRTPTSTVEATAAQRPRPPARTGRIELEPEPEPRPTSRLTGTRRALEGTPAERPSRMGPPVPPPREEMDGPTLDAPPPTRGTLTDVKLALPPPPVPDARTLSRVTPPPGPPYAIQGDEDAPTLAMPDVLRSPRVVSVPHEAGEEDEEDAPTLSLGMTRPVRASAAPVRQEAPPPAALPRWAWGAGAGLVALLVLSVVLWAWPKPPPATVRLETLPPGATVVFAGRLLEERTPLVLPPVEAGSYTVEVSRDGYEELRTTVEVPATGSASPGLLRLVPLPPRVVPAASKQAVSAQVRLRVETEPAEAIVFVDGQRQGPGPVVEVMAVAGRELAVRVEAVKHHPLVRAVKVGAGPQQLERFSLTPVPDAAPPDPGEGAQEVRTESRMGQVRFMVRPWAHVSCDGKRLGALDGASKAVELRVGSHECRFFNPDLGKTVIRRIEVKPSMLNMVGVNLE